VLGRPGPVGPQSIMLSLRNSGKNSCMQIVLTIESDAPGLAAVVVKETDIDARGVTREDGDAGAAFDQCHAKRIIRKCWHRFSLLSPSRATHPPSITYAQVMTVGAARPVRVPISAKLRAIWIRSARALCVSPPCFAGSGS
jgi:hypothetical protein